MPASDFSRRGFLAAAAGLAAAQAAGAPAPAAGVVDPDHPQRLSHALVLSGGGARGVYEAGIIDYLRLSKQIPEGSPLRPYEIVCGTSIGALNGYFVATGQYAKLRDLWYNIANQNVIKLKPEYSKIPNDDSGVGTRVAAAMRMAVGLATNATGVIDGPHLRTWLARYIDPGSKVLVPFVWPVTNLTTQSAEFFYLLPDGFRHVDHARAEQALRLTVGPLAVLREATPDILVDALRASAAIPVAFDPVKLPTAGGTGTNDYCDGGVTANTPIGVARAAAEHVDVILLDPPFQPVDHYKNAVDIGLGVFSAMQRRILEADVKSAFLEAFAKDAVAAVPNPPHALRSLSRELFASEFALIRPEKELPVDVAGFDDAQNLFKTFKLGFDDIRNGFVPYQYGADQNAT